MSEYLILSAGRTERWDRSSRLEVAKQIKDQFGDQKNFKHLHGPLQIGHDCESRQVVYGNPPGQTLLPPRETFCLRLYLERGGCAEQVRCHRHTTSLACVWTKHFSCFVCFQFFFFFFCDRFVLNRFIRNSEHLIDKF